MSAYFRFILRHQWIVLAFVLILTAAAGCSISRGIYASSIGAMFLGEDPAYQQYLDRIKEFGNNEMILVTYEDDRLLSPSSVSRIKKVSAVITGMKYVRSVKTVADVQKLEGKEGELLIRSYADLVLENPEREAEILDELRKDPFAAGLLISKDGKSGALLVEIMAESDIPAEAAPILIGRIHQAFADAGFDPDEIHTVGTPTGIAAIIDQTRFNVSRLFPLVCAVLLIAVWAMFKRLWPVALIMLVAVISVIWTFGFSVLLNRNISILASMIPPVILIISFSDVIHLCSAYLIELGKGQSKEEAILASGTDVGKACFFTSITTFFGFVAMSFVPAPVFRELGFVLGFGVAIALLLAMTLVPVFFSLLRKPKPWRTGATGRVQDLLDRVLEISLNIAIRKPWPVVFCFAFMAALSVFGLFSLTIETDFMERLDKDHRARKDQDYFLNHFNGYNMVDLYIDTNAKDGLIDPQQFEAIASLEEDISRLPEVSQVFSLVDLIEQEHKALAAGESLSGRRPDTRQALAQYLLLFEMSGGEDLDRLIDFNRQTMRMTIQLPDQAVRRTTQTGEKIGALARERLGDGPKIQVTGITYLMGNWLDRILEGQRRGLWFAIASIALMMVIGLKSVGAGLGSMIPNILPLLTLGGFLGLFWDQVDSDVLGIAMIAIGIGVDDTIHFLMRFRIESARQKDIQTALERTFHFSGRGIVITTVILVAGFAPFALSDYLSIHVMGTLLPMTLIVALAADLFLAPALVKLGVIRFGLKQSG